MPRETSRRVAVPHDFARRVATGAWIYDPLPNIWVDVTSAHHDYVADADVPDSPEVAQIRGHARQRAKQKQEAKRRAERREFVRQRRLARAKRAQKHQQTWTPPQIAAQWAKQVGKPLPKPASTKLQSGDFAKFAANFPKLSPVQVGRMVAQMGRKSLTAAYPQIFHGHEGVAGRVITWAHKLEQL